MQFQALIEKFLASTYYGNTGDKIAYFFALVLGVTVILKVFKLYFLSHLKRLAKKSKTKLDDAIVEFIDEIDWRIMLLVALIFSSRILVLQEWVSKWLWYFLLALLSYLIVKFVSKIIDHLIKDEIDKRLEADNADDTTAISVLGSILKVCLWAIALLFILSNLGVNITSLIAGIGIGGIAIAFALQKILEDLFSSFTIYFDKPFKKGDFIIVGTDMGTVKHIGIKTTRIQTLEGQELIISNRELTTARVNNYKKMEERRVLFSIGVVYDSTVAKLKEAKEIISEVVRGIESVRLDRVNFKKFNDYSLDFEIVYYLNTNDYNKYMEVQEKINWAIKDLFDRAGIEFAFPTRTLHLSNVPQKRSQSISG
ncbi:mechanosensitive ion channel family protein [Candidatus Woesearchaeota archaeon]|nr:mechanosensitive ion channel family protein [Candidatus Woesearchaeota archaeon]